MGSVSGKGNQARKTLAFYRVNFGHNPPYEVLCDGPTIFQALKNDLYLKQALPKLLGGPAYPVVTDCVVKELRSLGEGYSNAALFARRTKRISCVHEGRASAAECLTSRIQKRPETHFVLATIDPDVVAEVIRIPGIPIVSILNHTKFILKAPSPSTRNFVEAAQKTKVRSLSDPDKALVDQVKAAEKVLQEKKMTRKKRKRAQGPNPLSVKKRRGAHLEDNIGNQNVRSSLLPGSVAPHRKGASNTEKSIEKVGSSGSKTTDAQASLHEKFLAPDTTTGEARREGLVRASDDSCGTPDRSMQKANLDVGEDQEKFPTGSCSTPKSTRRRRRKNQNLSNDRVAGRTVDQMATKRTAAKMPGTTQRISIGIQDVSPLALKERPGTVTGCDDGEQQLAKDLAGTTVELSKVMTDVNGKRGPDTGRVGMEERQQLARAKPSFSVDDLDSDRSTVAGKVRKENKSSNISNDQAESKVLKENKSSDISKDREESSELHHMECENATSDGETVHAMASYGNQVSRECTGDPASSGTDGQKKKKQRKNRRRRPGKKAT